MLSSMREPLPGLQSRSRVIGEQIRSLESEIANIARPPAGDFSANIVPLQGERRRGIRLSDIFAETERRIQNLRDG